MDSKLSYEAKGDEWGSKPIGNGAVSTTIEPGTADPGGADWEEAGAESEPDG